MSSNPCRFCKKSKVVTLKCSRCKNESYCNKECQKIDWPFHKRFCDKNIEKEQEEINTIYQLDWFSKKELAESKQMYKKNNKNHIELLSKDVLLKIFGYLSIRELGKCAQVSRLFCKIAYNSTLWESVMVKSGPVSGKAPKI